MKRWQTLKTRSADQFVRQVGLPREVFMVIWEKVERWLAEERQRSPLKNRGKQTSSVPIVDRLLLTLYYLRHHPIFLNLADVFGISEGYANKLYHHYLDILVHVLKLPGHKALLTGDFVAILIDVTEQPMERPVKHQQQWYSGKKKQHTIKAQLMVCLQTLQILMVICGKGRTHDFKLLKHCHLQLAEALEKYADAGYQGLAKLFGNSFTPIKKPKDRALTPEEKAYNRALAKLRIRIEHVNRRCKIFRVVKETYRGKHRHIHKTWTVVAALVNFRYAE